MSIPGYNMQCSMSQVYKNELWPFVRDGVPATVFTTINTIDPATIDFFNTIHDEGAVERLFKEWNAAGRTYKMWSFYADKPAGEVLTIRADLDALNAADPQDFSVMGAWSCVTGAEVGGVGNEWYPVPPQYINFMPDIIVDNTDPENPVYGPATDPTDVNLLFGQEPRSFGSFYA